MENRTYLSGTPPPPETTSSNREEAVAVVVYRVLFATVHYGALATEACDMPTPLSGLQLEYVMGGTVE